MPLGRLGQRWAPLGPMRAAVSPPLSLSTGTGRFSRYLSPPLGAPVRCSHLFIYATFHTNMMACSRWVHSWLRVRGLVSPHLFLICSGGGGGASRSLSPLLRVSCTFPVTGCILLRLFIFASVFILFICITRVPALKGPVGFMLWGHMT